jgi:hypothetical protein
MKTGYQKALTILILVLTMVMLTSATKSPYFSRSVIITKVYPHKLGYKVIYMANDMKNRSVYLPSNLFETQKDETTVKSRLFQGYNKAYPYMTIFWKDGEFSHIKLYLKTNYSDISWGAFNDPDAHDENFTNAELKFDF